MKVNSTKYRKVRVDENKLCPWKEWRPYPNSLGIRLIVVVRQVGRQATFLQLTKLLKIHQLPILKHD